MSLVLPLCGCCWLYACRYGAIALKRSATLCESDGVSCCWLQGCNLELIVHNRDALVVPASTMTGTDGNSNRCAAAAGKSWGRPRVRAVWCTAEADVAGAVEPQSLGDPEGCAISCTSHW
jgi:hypothetical protein